MVQDRTAVPIGRRYLKTVGYGCYLELGYVGTIGPTATMRTGRPGVSWRTGF